MGDPRAAGLRRWAAPGPQHPSQWNERRPRRVASGRGLDCFHTARLNPSQTRRSVRSLRRWLHASGGCRLIDGYPLLRQEMSCPCCVFGQELGREATAKALAYGWEHWDRVGAMENPTGYSYRVGRSRSRSRRALPVFAPVPTSELPNVGPALSGALAGLSESYGSRRSEQAGLAALAKATHATLAAASVVLRPR